MKRKFLFTSFLFLTSFGISMAQRVAINETGADPHESAVLDVQSSSKGLLIPRMTSAQRNAIVNPAPGLMVCDVTTGSFWFRNATGQWVEMVSTENNFFSAGPTGIYTTETGIGIGTTLSATHQKLVARDSINNTIYFSLQNKHATGNTALYLLDQGSAIGGRFEFENTDKHLYIQNSQATGGDIIFRTNQYFETGSTSEEVFRIKRLGGIGIGISDPEAKLDIANASSTIGLHIDQTTDTSAHTYGILNNNNSEGSGQKYGIYTRVYGKATSQEIYGSYQHVLPSGHSMDAYGGYCIVDTAGSGTHYGMYTKAEGIGNYALYSENSNGNGWAGYFVGRTYLSGRLGIGVDTPMYRIHVVSSNKRSLHMETSHASSDSSYGIYNLIKPVGNGVRYGMFSRVELDPSNMASAFGIRVEVENEGTGVHRGLSARALGDDNIGVEGIANGTGIGVKGINTNSNGWAGYFEGDTYVHDRLEVRDKIFLRPVGSGSGGEIELYDDDGDESITIRAGQSTTNGAEILMFNDDSVKTIELDADFNLGKGRIITDELEITGGSDLAEHFDILHTTALVPGTLVSVDPSGSGKLIPTKYAYDTRIAGVISGANGVSPGMLMGQKSSIADGDFPVALAGRVYVLADATLHPIIPGDLMTSSPRAGYAMAVKKYRRAQGAVIGKALTGLKEGTGYVMILVNLQ